MIVDDDPGTCAIFKIAFRNMGVDAVTVNSGEEAFRVIHSRDFDATMIDVRLPDTDGLDIVEALCRDFPALRVVVVSGFLTTKVTVKAMKLGAIEVLEKPVHIDDLEQVVLPLLSRGQRPFASRVSSQARVRDSKTLMDEPVRTAQERWATMVLRVCDAEYDPRTLSKWAEIAAVSLSSLCELCQLVGVRPHEARDLARVLHATIQSRELACHPKLLLHVSDRRTLRSLLLRAGLVDAKGDSPRDLTSVGRLLRCQQFVSHDNLGFKTLVEFLARRGLIDEA